MDLHYIVAGQSLALDSEACIGCGMCVEVCPHAVFSMSGRKAAIDARERCMECGACARNCPARAIAVESGVGCAYAIINGLISGKEPSCGCDDSCGDGAKPKRIKAGCC
jgi:NAD-dependent dihydropyrimidine dehydrogenase PreA subunit